MTGTGNSGSLRSKLLEVMKVASCLLDGSGKKSGPESRLGGVRQVSLYFALS